MQHNHEKKLETIRLMDENLRNKENTKRLEREKEEREKEEIKRYFA